MRAGRELADADSGEEGKGHHGTVTARAGLQTGVAGA
jgi:hypothetical protein